MLSDGGLVLGVPFLAALAVLVFLAVRALPSSLRAGDWVQPGAATVLLVLLLHSGMDFDWAYPSLLSTVAVIGAVAVPTFHGQGVRQARLGWVIGAVAVGLLVASAIGGWDGGLQLNTVITG